MPVLVYESAKLLNYLKQANKWSISDLDWHVNEQQA